MNFLKFEKNQKEKKKEKKIEKRKSSTLRRKSLKRHTRTFNRLRFAHRRSSNHEVSNFDADSRSRTLEKLGIRRRWNSPTHHHGRFASIRAIILVFLQEKGEKKKKKKKRGEKRERERIGRNDRWNHRTDERSKVSTRNDEKSVQCFPIFLWNLVRRGGAFNFEV